MTPKEAIAQHLMMDISELNEYRYHYGFTSIPVYGLTDFYLCCTKKGKSPATYKGEQTWEWKEVKNDFINNQGLVIWKSLNN